MNSRSNSDNPHRRRRSYSPLDPSNRGPNRGGAGRRGTQKRTGGNNRPVRSRTGSRPTNTGTRTSTTGTRTPHRRTTTKTPAHKTARHTSRSGSHSSARAARGMKTPTKRAAPPRKMPQRGTASLSANGDRKDDVVPELKPGVIRVIPLGGVEEIGRNMTAIEIGDDILVVDCGFQFKEVETPGIDYILPNTKYLEDNKHRIRAMFITHGHLDHIGGIPFIIDRIGMPPIYTRNLTAIMVKKRQHEFPHIPELDMKVVEKNEKIKVGNLSVSFFGVTHTIPDSMGICVDTPNGGIVVPSDYKLTHVDGVVDKEELENYKFFDNKKTLLLLLDSTNVDNPGWSTPESAVHENLGNIIRETKGRLIIGTFASQLERLIGIIANAEKCKKKIVLEGRSMKTNMEIAIQAGLLKVKKDTIIPAQEIGDYPKSKIVVLATGAQGEEFAAMMRMANKSHKFIRFEKDDTILLSASVIPGNEKSVDRLKDNIARGGAKIITYRTSDVYVHSTGHGNRSELEWLHKRIKPKFFVPIHGSHHRLRSHADLAYSCGMPEDHVVVPDNSSIIEVSADGSKIMHLKEKAPSAIRMVDGLNIGDVQEVVIKDRQALAEDGMFVVIALLNVKTGKLRKSPDIISRGFVYLRESQDLLQETRVIAKKTVEEAAHGMNPINFEFIRKQLSDAMSAYLLQKTHKHPIVIPVLLGV